MSLTRPIAVVTVAGLAGIALAVLAGCKDERVRVYDAPKDRRIVWTLPAGWQAVANPEPSPGRYATLRAGEDPDAPRVEVSVWPDIGMMADPLANLNRWRAQLQLPSIGADQLLTQLDPVVTADQTGGYVADLLSAEPATGGPPRRLVAVMLMRPGHVWFVKVLGPQPAVDTVRDDLLTFVQSFAFQEGRP